MFGCVCLFVIQCMKIKSVLFVAVVVRTEMGHLFWNSSSQKTSSSDGFERVSKVVLMIVGVVWCLFLVWIAVIPSLSTLPCFRPPYAYILLNFIILSIAFSSSFHIKIPEKVKTLHQDDQFEAQQVVLVHEEEEEETVKKQIVVDPLTAPISDDVNIFPGTKISRESLEEEKQMVMAEAEEDSLDSIWKNIMESQGNKPQLNKCDTWNSPPNVEAEEDDAIWGKREMRKCETFIRREKMVSQDELNLRADAFIKKFNLEMKLEREESHLRQINTLNRRLQYTRLS